MFIEPHYIVKPQFMHMAGHYDRNGKLCSLVFETNRILIVDKSPLEIIADSIRWIGFNLKGAMESARWLLGSTHMCPLVVNPIQQIVLFPTRAARHEDTIWFNPEPIFRTYSQRRNTIILFTNGSTLTVPIRLTSFNTKLQSAEQLKIITRATANHTFSFILDPATRPVRKKRRKNKKRQAPK
ncbi:competence protein ComK [Bacillus sp. FJAT-27251]|uniref:competence protein ComK n=1 Tax=Bacillus sp. FJAT-27251 TaxID=1684142 RepID=UPI0006A7B600|nr:competence protein ComK [Bacillus sp. FJAT-27251]